MKSNANWRVKMQIVSIQSMELYCVLTKISY